MRMCSGFSASSTHKPCKGIKVRDSATKEEFNRQLLLILQELHKTLTLLDSNCSRKNQRLSRWYEEEASEHCGGLQPPRSSNQSSEQHWRDSRGCVGGVELEAQQTGFNGCKLKDNTEREHSPCF